MSLGTLVDSTICLGIDLARICDVMINLIQEIIRVNA